MIHLIIFYGRVVQSVAGAEKDVLLHLCSRIYIIHLLSLAYIIFMGKKIFSSINGLYEPVILTLLGVESKKELFSKINNESPYLHGTKLDYKTRHV